MPEILAAARFWLDLAAIIGTVISAVVGATWWMIRHSLVTHRALGDAIEPIGTEVDAQDKRITKLESDVSHMPDAGAWQKMQVQMTRLEGGMQNVETQITGLRDTMERIERPLNVLVDSKLKAGT